ncbi:TetR/AcrR family transcriptional regulator [Pseudoroseomonas cervicalis]|uniref:TetR/AcrR family transcriptional regulator n=1 Tax=Teichococcus cervicalis TaxID=204525 RepID=UPI0022F1D5DA|nr:TetR/AcrR family transcriptional regulator [Pseudoroseomonas cervicalis]WBV45424.1 TetR/AcrR family transcriptional regulator [Pseudoroseomonas cervicalis]
MPGMECTTPPTPPARRGRPPGFDRAEALRRALRLFWDKGYEAATMAQLRQAMGGLCAPSVYAAFGSKEQLFRAALDLYQQESCAWARAALDRPTAREAVRALLEQAAHHYSAEGQPAGCLLDLALTGDSPETAPVAALLRERRLAGEAALRARLQAGQAAGELPAGADLDAMAGFYRAVLVGLSSQAQDGAPRERLLAIAAAAMRAWAGWASPA